MIKIFFFDKIIYLTDKLRKKHRHFYEYKTKKKLEKKLNKFSTDVESKELIIFYKDLKKLWKAFKSCFLYIKAAGGLVKNNKGQILIIKRLGKWDLPKGKIEHKEKPRKTALREIHEECGITAMKIIKKLTPTYHTYFLNEAPVLKKSIWYEMFYEGEETLHPQAEENITEIKWADKSEILTLTDNTYLSILDVLKEAEIIPIFLA